MKMSYARCHFLALQDGGKTSGFHFHANLKQVIQTLIRGLSNRCTSVLYLGHAPPLVFLPFPNPRPRHTHHGDEPVSIQSKRACKTFVKTNQNCCRIRMLFHCLNRTSACTPTDNRSTYFCHTILQVLLIWGIFNDGDNQRVKIRQRPSCPTHPNSLNHLLMRDRKHIPRPPQSRHHRMLRMRVNAASSITQIECVPE